ncbi:hypothetical protein ET475_05430 [Microbacterium protaetiae]|uniref:Uncharacterized protein n=1 Tax=Microbacterium protaetiae TaxID=2509458 RepID=A0A4V0YDS5_9MICO|nr:hypothetical protein ET475_05430 [Microbacterium protaetiae]
MPPRRTHLARDLTAIVVTVVVLLAALGTGGFFLYRALYSPSAFVQHYLSLLSTGHAADALHVPGVAIDRSQLEAAGLPKNSSEALLRRSALSALTDVRVESETTAGDVTQVTVSYLAGQRYPGTTTFSVEQSGWAGFVPTWRFARSPLAVIDLTVHGSMSFQVNNFRLDKRQLALAGSSVQAADAVPMLVFSPGLYSVRVDTTISYSAGVAVLSDAPLKNVPVQVQTTPTDKFVAVVQDRVDDFLDQCATQQVLQPTGCPFGYVVDNRIAEPPQWSIEKTPKVSVVPDGEGWAIPETKGDAHIVVDIQSIYDGSITHIDEDVPFAMVGTIDIGANGAASIRVSEPGG